MVLTGNTIPHAVVLLAVGKSENVRAAPGWLLLLSIRSTEEEGGGCVVVRVCVVLS